ncbi:MAG: efflux RND transporter periplasmic adaptor subunit [Nannocystaceae bacterium]
MNRRIAALRRFSGLLAALALGGLALGACAKPASVTDAAAGPAAVEVVRAEAAPVPSRFEFIGTVEAVQRVELRARVRGYITAVKFEEGALLEANQVLYEIDTRPLKAEQRSAAASVRQIQARLVEARRTLARDQQLLRADVTSQADVDASQAEVDALEAELNAQRAQLQQANLDIGYSKIRAPFEGRVGERLVDVGELVGEGDSTLLAVVVQEDPVFVRFAPSERERRQMLEVLPTLEDPESAGEVAVGIMTSDGERHDGAGRLAFVDNVFDTSTRSIVYKVVIDNPGRRLKPGESVSVTLELPASVRVVVPLVAVASVQDVDYVYVVDADDVARYREVKLGVVVGERTRVVESGIEPGDRVVVRGAQQIEDGAQVEVRDAAERGRA